MKKYIFGAVLSLGILVSPMFAQAAGLTGAQIQSILSLLSAFGADSATIANVNAALTGTFATGTQWCHTFGSDLTVDSSSGEVTALNQALTSSGISIGGRYYFDENTAAAVVQFQAKYGIRQTGYVGPITRAKLNQLYGCSAPTTIVPVISSISPTTFIANIGGEMNVRGTNLYGNAFSIDGISGLYGVMYPDSSGTSADILIPPTVSIGSHTLTAIQKGTGTPSNAMTFVAVAPTPLINSFSVNGYSEVINGKVNIFNVINPTVQWSASNASYCMATSVEGITREATADFTGVQPTSGSKQLMFGDSYYNQREITLTCYSQDGVPSNTVDAWIGGKG